ncbi:MAG: hypothetical protein ACLTV6_04310 [Christensenellales bacterium]
MQEYRRRYGGFQQYTAWTDRFLASAEQTRITGKEMDRVVAEMHEGSQTLSGAYEQFTRQTQENLGARPHCLTRAFLPPSISNETLDSMREMTRSMPQLLSQSRDRYRAGRSVCDRACAAAKAMEKLTDGGRKE